MMRTNELKMWGCGLVLAALCAWMASPAFGAGQDVSSAERPKANLAAVREKAESMPSDARREIDKRIAITVERVNHEAADGGQATMTARLAAEFKLTEESLLDEKAEHSLSWGEIVIAHTLLANSGTGLTIVDLAQLRREGLGWGAIAFGLQFHMEDFEDAIKAEGRVAMGLPKADGKAATIAK
jgi:hypothetical protein